MPCRNVSNSSPAPRAERQQPPSSPAAAATTEAAAPPAAEKPKRPNPSRRPQSFAAPKGQDPFFVTLEAAATAAPASGKIVRPTPSLDSAPSGKLASRRRGRKAPDSPTPSHAKAVPVRHVSNPVPGLSRSVPTSARTPVPPRRSETVEFPVVNDVSDSEDDTDSFDESVPPMASQYRFSTHNGVPRTPSPPRARVHSGGLVVAGAFDEDYLNTPTDGDLKAMLFGLSAPSAATPAPAFKMDMRFANSHFQNSPNPEDLPMLPF
jgi:hypothetical protein